MWFIYGTWFLFCHFFPLVWYWQEDTDYRSQQGLRLCTVMIAFWTFFCLFSFFFFFLMPPPVLSRFLLIFTFFSLYRLLPGPGKGSRGSERENLLAEPFPGFTGQTSQTPSSHVDQVNTKSQIARSTSSCGKARIFQWYFYLFLFILSSFFRVCDSFHRRKRV